MCVCVLDEFKPWAICCQFILSNPCVIWDVVETLNHLEKQVLAH